MKEKIFPGKGGRVHICRLSRALGMDKFPNLEGTFLRESNKILCYTAKIMGQIVIDIPNKKNRRYVFTDAKRANEFLTALEASAVRVKDTPPSLDELEYAEDVRDVEKALAEYKRTGKTHKWADVKAELGL